MGVSVLRGVMLASVSTLAMLAAPLALAADLPPASTVGESGNAAGTVTASWTGFYLGTYVGSGLVDTSWGAGTGVLAPTAVPPGTNSGSASAAMIGSQVGYNYQIGSYVLGVEGELGSGFQMSRTRCLGDWASVCSAQTDYLATLAARLGYAFDNVLVYGKAGAAFTNTSVNTTGFTYAGRYSGSSFETGWTVGAGVEMGLTPQLSAKAEYAYLDFGSSTMGLNSGFGAASANVSQSAQMVKLGLNWRPAAAPLPGTGAGLPVPGRDWTGLYLGLNAGGAWGRDEWTSGTGFLAAAATGGSFPGEGTAMGLLGGGQVGYNYQMGAWVVGAEVSASAANISSYAKCVSGNAGTPASFACHNSVDSLGAISARLGQSWGDLMFYGKAGAAWATGSSSLFPTSETQHFTNSGTRWGWMIGSGVEYALTQNFSAFLEYDYYDFGTQSLAYAGAGRSATASFKERLDAVRMGLNYRFASGTDAPASGLFKAPELPSGWSAEVGGRYFVSTGRMQKDLMHPVLPDRLNSRLIYGNTTGQSLETFFRFENRDGLFLKGFAGLGTLSGGSLYDEDFPADIAYSNTISDLKDGQLAYGALDLGMELVRQGESSLGAFVGYRALYQNVNGFGCRQIASDTTCDVASQQAYPALLSSIGLSETETWQGVALGLNSRMQLSDRLRLEVDAAYLPYATRSSADNHWFRADINPQAETGHGWGAQLEAVLSYAVTDRLNMGLGGRYWYFATNEASTVFPYSAQRSPMAFYAERYGAFLQASYRFGDLPPADATGMPVKAEAAPANWTGLYVGGALGGGKAHSTYDSPFATPVTGDAVDLGGAMAGVQVGGDYQWGALVLGAEATAGWANVVGTDTCFSTAPLGAESGINCGSRVNALGTVTGRVGYAFDRTLLYARGGFAWDRQSDQANLFNFTGSVRINDSTNTGWTLGGGVDYALLPNLSVGLEYKHFDFGGSSAFSSAQPWPLAGVDLAPASLRLDMVAMTVNYRFATFGGGQ
ncbi:MULTISPECIES: outer membrane protein [unclassified Xanthobacter]|uniref:outer membrane protein n=1 Tax=unclassified Xanthobacter TaxID=2623496 RepID=UPI001F1AF366|nr:MULTISPECIES: outer membrane beta-barrel protein [unclassified Xanthobacter]